MSTTNTTDSLPLGTSESAGKPATPKPAAKAPAPKAPAAEVTTKATPANPEWAAEVASNFGLTGHIAKAAATEIIDAVQSVIAKKFDRSRLAKIVRNAVAKSIN